MLPGTCEWADCGLEVLKARDDESPGSSSGVDQLLGGQARPRSQVGQVALDGARSDADEFRRVRDRSASGNVGGEDVLLALSRWKSLASRTCHAGSRPSRELPRRRGEPLVAALDRQGVGC